ncbi:Aldehyde dehydrogenase, thermostable [bacterium HR10]|uniref:Aldehyde dehydrogenase n=1 Tax=uncultured Acidobacteriota bacterium TaxID=171953 RepID=H5SG58_9BACT|nr:aldehyde dehydrogenase [uncultured Acidobacteriota bacterium]GBC83182.1 Aldehyde dehydrogenase, thermostable [bacterium HR10]
MRLYENFIDGEWVTSRSDATLENVNPATGDILGLVRLSRAEEAREAIAHAAAAFEKWRSTPAPIRGQIVLRAAALLAERKERVAALITREEGKTLGESMGEVERTIRILEYAAGEARRLRGETLPSELPDNFIYTVRQPLGVVGIITPWNVPLAIPAWKIAPALVAGNTVVLKPSPLVPETATCLVELFAEAGVPPGVLNMILGEGETVGQEIVQHPHVRALSFTGSTAVGLKLYEHAAGRGIKIQCEMGGKNAVLVLEDADVSLAVDATVQGAFGATGQRCSATSRAIVVEAIADRFVELMRERAARLRVGPGEAPETDMGPVVDRNHLDAVLSYIALGREEGAELISGGRRLTEGRLGRGYFVEPTIFDHVRPTMRIAQEEIFGPVLSIIRVKDFDEAVRVANSVRYGLSCSIFTRDVSRVFTFADRVEAGIVHINSPTTGGEAHVPFGGLKSSGIGPREQGSTQLDFYTELKVVYVDYTGRARRTNLY